MTEQNISVVQKIFGEFTTGDISGPPQEYLTEDVEWIISGSIDDPFTGRYSGKERVKHLFTHFTSITKSDGYEITDYITQGDKVVVTGTEKVHFKPSGRSLDGSFVYVITLHEGKIAKFHAIYGSP
ncbi:nuclear transport factor 2 family protein [Aerosakkonema funiforme]|uniref:nuclear transport factor 2 family protein n=1 Tax=Aerosakkonema funiforme TaxID=1246630 RepID=UPI0035BABA6F